MKQWVWVLVLPYVIIPSITKPGCFVIRNDHNWSEIICSQDYAEDLAQALNDAHTARVLRKEWNPPKGVDPDNFDTSENKKLYWKNDSKKDSFDFDKACKGSCAEDK